jgi:mannose-6-phosphate isomerase-like protein (cupin superfamily)
MALFYAPKVGQDSILPYFMMYTALVNYSRRDLTLLLPALAAASAPAQTPALPSKTYRFEDLPVHAGTASTARAVFDGKTHTGFPVNLHITELPLGGAPHPPHHHVHEEMIMIHEGTLEVTIAGRSATLGPGSVAYVASGEEHGWRNVGTTRAQYFVLAVGQER